MANCIDPEECVVLSKTHTSLKREFAFTFKSQSEFASLTGHGLCMWSENRSNMRFKINTLTHILRIRDKIQNNIRRKMHVLNEYSRKKHIYFPNEWPVIKIQLSKNKIHCQDLFQTGRALNYC